MSSAGVLRGLHFAQVPPSQAKYVTCVRGAVFDVVVDIRVGSPTFGQWDSVLLDDTEHRTIYLSEGLGHGFLALQDNSTVMYLCSAEYNPQREHTICATDPALGIDWPLVDGAPPTLSDRDAAAPSLDDVRASGLLPTWRRRTRSSRVCGQSPRIDAGDRHAHLRRCALSRTIVDARGAQNHLHRLSCLLDAYLLTFPLRAPN